MLGTASTFHYFKLITICSSYLFQLYFIGTCFHYVFSWLPPIFALWGFFIYLYFLNVHLQACETALGLRRDKFDRNASYLKRQLTWQYELHCFQYSHFL